MAAGLHPDYREITPDARTKTGRVSRRRELRIDQLVPRKDGDPDPLSRWLERRPQFTYRVGVIDHAEALNLNAANAFLKVLEEPPSYARILLIAPSREAVLPTIASRSTVLRLSTVDPSLVNSSHREHHPATRLGRPGDLLGADAHPEAFETLLGHVDRYLLSLEKGLEEALERADALEKAWTAEAIFDVPELLRARLSEWPPAHYVASLKALERCEQALQSYASPTIAVQVLTLDLRATQRIKAGVGG